MTPIHKHGWPTCSLASQICRRAGLLNCCHGIGTIRTCRWSLDLAVMLYAIRGPRRMLSLQIASGAVIKSASLRRSGDGNDMIIANDLGDTIQSGRGTGRRNGRE